MIEEIYFRDLKKSKQKELLRLYHLKNADDENFDYFPLFTLEIEDDI